MASERDKLVTATSGQRSAANLSNLTLINDNFRFVALSTTTCQIACMSIEREVKQEQHLFATQIITIVQGSAIIRMEGRTFTMDVGQTLVIPPGAVHQITNERTNQILKLYTIYAPPLHEPQSVEPDEE